MCVCVEKDLANRLTDIVLLYSKASHRSSEGINLLSLDARGLAVS